MEMFSYSMLKKKKGNKAIYLIKNALYKGVDSLFITFTWLRLATVFFKITQSTTQTHKSPADGERWTEHVFSWWFVLLRSHSSLLVLL